MPRRIKCLSTQVTTKLTGTSNDMLYHAGSNERGCWTWWYLTWYRCDRSSDLRKVLSKSSVCVLRQVFDILGLSVNTGEWMSEWMYVWVCDRNTIDILHKNLRGREQISFWITWEYFLGREFYINCHYLKAVQYLSN